MVFFCFCFFPPMSEQFHTYTGVHVLDSFVLTHLSIKIQCWRCQWIKACLQFLEIYLFVLKAARAGSVIDAVKGVYQATLQPLLNQKIFNAAKILSQAWRIIFRLPSFQARGFVGPQCRCGADNHSNGTMTEVRGGPWRSRGVRGYLWSGDGPLPVLSRISVDALLRKCFTHSVGEKRALGRRWPLRSLCQHFSQNAVWTKTDALMDFFCSLEVNKPEDLMSKCIHEVHCILKICTAWIVFHPLYTTVLYMQLIEPNLKAITHRTLRPNLRYMCTSIYRWAKAWGTLCRLKCLQSFTKPD